MGKYNEAVKALKPAIYEPMDTLPGQIFANANVIRAALFDVIDRGDQDEQPWMFYENEDPRSDFDQDAANVDRSNFADAVLARIAELLSLGGIKLENLCDKHKRQCLPAPTAKVCSMCEGERKDGLR